MEACLHNLRLWLESVQPEAAAGADPMSIPGIAVLVDILGASLRLLPRACPQLVDEGGLETWESWDAGERQAMRSTLQLVLQGTDSLAGDRKDSPAGPAKEAALLAALRLLRTALELDVPTLRALQQGHHQSGRAPLPGGLAQEAGCCCGNQ